MRSSMMAGQMSQIVEEANLRMSTTDDRDESYREDDDQSFISSPIVSPGIFGGAYEIKAHTGNMINLFQAPQN